MTAILERVPVDRVSDRAHAARPGRVLLVAVTGIGFALGWLAFKAAALVWLGVAWAAAAVAEGWVAARDDTRRKQVRRGAARAG